MSPASEDGIKAVDELKAAIAGGKHWYIALLEAIGLWTTAEETHNGRLYRYLIAGEAFDWLLLAERLQQRSVFGGNLVDVGLRRAGVFLGRGRGAGKGKGHCGENDRKPPHAVILLMDGSGVRAP